MRTTGCFLVLVLAVVSWAGTAAAGPELEFIILHTNDEHSHLVPHSPALGPGGHGGYARLAAAVQAVRRDATVPVLLVSAGDFTAGTPFHWLALEGEAPEIELMLELGYDVVTLGNHEFDFGARRLASYLLAAGYPQAAERTPIVASNLEYDAGHPLAGVGLRPTLVIEPVPGLRVGFFGLLGKEAQRVLAVPGELGFSPEHEAATRAVAALRAQGAGVVVALTHSGLEADRLLARSVPGIDLIIGGHCHTTLSEPVREGKTLIVQSGPLLAHLGVLELAFNPDTGTLRVKNRESGRPFLVPLDAAVGEDAAVAARVADYATAVAGLLSRLSGGRYRSLATTVARLEFVVTDAELDESPLGNLVTDALRHAAAVATGQEVDFAFMPNGVLRGALTPAGGRLGLYDLLWPLSLGLGPDGRPGYPVVAVYLTGEEVRRALEISVLGSELMGDSYFLQVSGLTVRYDRARAVLAYLPVLNKPIPTQRAVLEARHAGTGELITRGDGRLYHVVSDYQTVAFIPRVGAMLPSLAVTPRDAQGRPLADLSGAIVHVDGEELKVWQAVLGYLQALPPGPDGLPLVPEGYAAAEGRLVKVKTLPLWLGPLGLLGLVVGGGWAWRRRRSACRPRRAGV